MIADAANMPATIKALEYVGSCLDCAYIKPYALYNCHRQNLKLRSGRLGDVAPAVVQLIGLAAPKEMTGHSLIQS